MKTYTMHALVFLDLTQSPPTVSRVLLTSSRHVTNMTREAATELWSTSSPVSLADARRKLLRVLSEPPFEWTLPWLSESDRPGGPRVNSYTAFGFAEVPGADEVHPGRPLVRSRRPFHGPGGE